MKINDLLEEIGKLYVLLKDVRAELEGQRDINSRMSRMLGEALRFIEERGLKEEFDEEMAKKGLAESPASSAAAV